MENQLGNRTEDQKIKVTLPFDDGIDQGAATTLVTALDRGLMLEKSVFLNDCQVMDGPPYEISKEKAQRLSELSEKLVTEKLRSAI